MLYYYVFYIFIILLTCELQVLVEVCSEYIIRYQRENLNTFFFEFDFDDDIYEENIEVLIVGEKKDVFMQIDIKVYINFIKMKN